MKKNVLIITLFIAIGAISCKSGGSFESDVRKFSEIRCELQKVEAKDPNDEKVKEEKEKLQKKMKEFSDKMEKKYADREKDSAMNAKADKIFDEVMEKCK